MSDVATIFTTVRRMEWVRVIVTPEQRPRRKRKLGQHFLLCNDHCLASWGMATSTRPSKLSIASLPAVAQEHCAHCAYCGLLLWGTKSECVEHDEAGCPTVLFTATVAAQGFAEGWQAITHQEVPGVPDEAWELAERLWRAGEWKGYKLAEEVHRQLRCR